MIPITKLMAKSGLYSRRKANVLFENGDIKLKNEILTRPYVEKSDLIHIRVLNRIIGPDLLKSASVNSNETDQMIHLFYKKRKFVLSSHDTLRPSIFHDLYKKHRYLFFEGENIPGNPIDKSKSPAVLEKEAYNLWRTTPIQGKRRLMAVGNIDYVGEGLVLLTNDGTIQRKLTHPSNGYNRVYLCCLNQKFTDWNKQDNNTIHSPIPEDNGISIMDGNHLIVPSLTPRGGKYWIKVVTKPTSTILNLREYIESFGPEIKRMICIQYGPYTIENLKVGEVKQVKFHPIDIKTVEKPLKKREKWKPERTDKPEVTVESEWL